MFRLDDKKLHIASFRIVLVYFTFSLLWIYFSDTILLFFIKDVIFFAEIQTYKGFAFVAITSLLIFILIKSKLAETSEMQLEIKDKEQRLSYVIQGSNLGYWDWDYITGEHLVNDRWLEILALKRSDIKNDASDWLDLVHPDDKEIGFNAIQQTIKDNNPYTIEFRMKHKDGHWIWIEGSGAIVERDETTGQPLRIAGTHKDITHRKIAEEKMNFLAFNDPLTSLPNRTFLKNTLDEFLGSVERKPFAFLFLDLDFFKNINDAFGHSFGDQVIQDVAKRFKETLKEEDFIARVGGDEFVILTHDVDHVKELCVTLALAIEKPFCVKGETFSLGTSIGITLFPDDDENFEALFKNADTAMYVAKGQGKNRYVFYTPDMGDKAVESIKMDMEIKRALEEDEFILHYQPQFDLKTGRVVGAEALVRWEDPKKGMISPGDFIPRAEETRLMIPLGNVVMKKALYQMKQWQDRNLFKGKMAINISSVQFEEDDFIETLTSVVADVGIEAKYVELEVTESAIMKNEARFITTLQELRELGFSISIDDFGTGYSSLNYIKKLPIDTLKIDRTFVKDTPHDQNDTAIAMVIITLAKQLGVEVVAEGIETKDQQKFLKENGCHKAQGFLLAYPMNATSFEDFCQLNLASF